MSNHKPLLSIRSIDFDHAIQLAYDNGLEGEARYRASAEVWHYDSPAVVAACLRRLADTIEGGQV